MARSGDAQAEAKAPQSIHLWEASMFKTTVSLVFLLALAPPASAQWPAHTSPNMPRNGDGTVNLSAPAPRTNHGSPDLSGVWMPQPDPNGKPEGVENVVFPRYLNNVTQDLEDPNGLLVPSAASRYRQRLATEGADDPIANCQPAGSPRIFSMPRPTKIIETPGVMLLLHEHETTFRQIFTDGRSLPEDPIPTWMGYSIGRWDHDAFIVTTIGMTERSWLDVQGHPHSEALVMTERFRRIDVGQLDVEITYTDPGAFKMPLTITQKLRLLADQDLIESYCSDNERDRPRYVTAQSLAP
jgi:hypothetical protein